jgi:hypothetical protein
MNWNGKYVSLKTIISSVYRDMKVADNLDFLDAVEWAGEALEFIGGPYTFEQKISRLEIKNYRAKLPCELHYIETTKGAPMHHTEDSCPDNCSYIPMRYTTDSFHHSYCANNCDTRCQSQLTYMVNDDFIITSFEEGYVLMSYQAIPVDEEGYPKVPDTVKFKRAVISHISWRVASILADDGKIPQWRYQKYEQERDWYIGAAQTSQQMPSIDMMESIKNNWLRMIPKINQHADSFKSAGSAEQRIIHNNITHQTSPNSGDKKTYFNT